MLAYTCSGSACFTVCIPITLVKLAGVTDLNSKVFIIKAGEVETPPFLINKTKPTRAGWLSLIIYFALVKRGHR
jgi:hypothetical protein